MGIRKSVGQPIIKIKLFLYQAVEAYRDTM
jgi:hypothetical protein